jgi:hypothetical protein
VQEKSFNTEETIQSFANVVAASWFEQLCRCASLCYHDHQVAVIISSTDRYLRRSLKTLLSHRALQHAGITLEAPQAFLQDYLLTKDFTNSVPVTELHCECLE